VFALGGSAEIDRGAPYMEVSEKTPMGSPFISDQAARNTAEITDAATPLNSEQEIGELITQVMGQGGAERWPS
jgi:hypothetical protein